MSDDEFNTGLQGDMPEIPEEDDSEVDDLETGDDEEGDDEEEDEDDM